MVIGLKDGLKLVGMTIVTFCAVFVCTFFLNFYTDAIALDGVIESEGPLRILYDAQMTTAKIVCSITGGFLSAIAVVILVFYIKLYIDGHAKQIGILKAMGYSDSRIAVGFSVFGVSVLLGSLSAYGVAHIFMPVLYDSMTISGTLEISVTFQPLLFVLLGFAPAAVYALLSFAIALIAVKQPVSELLRGKSEKVGKKDGKRKDKERSFMKEMCLRTTFGKKSLAFFVAFACFCFSAMVQMSVSMLDLSSENMGIIIFIIGIVLAVTTILMAVTSLLKANVKNIAVMKAVGYPLKDCALVLLGGYHLFAVIGFALGTGYQYGLLRIMCDIIYKELDTVADYHFDVPVFFITLAAFVVFYEAVMAFYVFRMNKISVKEIMTEN